MEENDRLQKQVSQLVCENGYMKQQLRTVSVFSSLSILMFSCFPGVQMQNVLPHNCNWVDYLVFVA